MRKVKETAKKKTESISQSYKNIVLQGKKKLNMSFFPAIFFQSYYCNQKGRTPEEERQSSFKDLAYFLI